MRRTYTVLVAAVILAWSYTYGVADFPVVGGGSGTTNASDLSSGVVATARGGTAQDSSSSTGVPYVLTGTWSFKSVSQFLTLIGMSTTDNVTFGSLTATNGITVPQGTSAGCITLWEGAANGTDNITICAPAAVTTPGYKFIFPAAVCASGYVLVSGGDNTYACAPMAPVNGSYLTATSESGLSGETNLGALATGMVKATVAGGTATMSTVSATGFSVTASGTAATITDNAAALDFGTTDPSVSITTAGTYYLSAQARITTSSATFTAPQNVTCYLYRTNNTPAIIANSYGVSLIPIITTTSLEIGSIMMGPVVYTTTNTNDAIAIYCSLSASAGAGSVTATGAWIQAPGLFN